jgi:hypothetical protein
LFCRMILSQKSFKGQKGTKGDNRRYGLPATILLAKAKQIRPPALMAEQ